MKSRSKTSVIAVILFGTMASPGQLAAQASEKHHHYKVIDMGTFGGSLSSINMAVDVNGHAVNMSGATVGFSATATPRLPTSHPIICGGDDGFGSFITHAFRWQNGNVTDLQALPPVETKRFKPIPVPRPKNPQRRSALLQCSA